MKFNDLCKIVTAMMLAQVVTVCKRCYADQTIVSSVTTQSSRFEKFAISPDDPPDLKEARKLYNDRDYSKSLEAYKNYLKSAEPAAPQKANALYESARTFYNVQHYDEAIARSLEVALNYPGTQESCKALLLAGLTQAGLARWVDADLTFNRLTHESDRCPEVAEARFQLIETAYNRGDLRAAVERFREFDQKNRQDCRVKPACDNLLLAHDRNSGPRQDDADWVWLKRECFQLKIPESCFGIAIQ